MRVLSLSWDVLIRPVWANVELIVLLVWLGSSRATTLVAARFEGGVVIGADSRTSQGNFVANRLTDKITSIYPGIFLARSGNSADTQFVAEVLEAKMEAYRTEFGRPPTVLAAATATRNLCYSNREQLNAGVICAGWDERDGGSVFSIPQGGSLFKQPYAVSGSGSVYALGYCDEHLRPHIGREECVRHVQTALELALSRDGASGGIIRLCVATAKGVERWSVAPPEENKPPRRGIGEGTEAQQVEDDV